MSAAASQNLASLFWDQDPKIVELLLEKRLRCLQRYFPSRRLDILQTMADLAAFKCRLCKLDEATQLCTVVLSQPINETFTYRAVKADVYETLGAICVIKEQYQIADVCYANAASFYSSRGPFDPYYCGLINSQIYAKYHSGNYPLAFQMALQLEMSLKSQKGLWRDDLLESTIRKQCICAFGMNKPELFRSLLRKLCANYY